MAAVKWDVAANLEVTGIDGTLAVDTSDASVSIDADADGWTHGDLVVDLNATAAFVEDEILADVYLVRQVNAVFEDFEQSTTPWLPPEAYIGTCFATHVTGGPSNTVFRGIELPPFDFQIVLHNRHDAAFTTVDVDILRYRLQVI